jgi:predicted nucleic acid-binding protein
LIVLDTNVLVYAVGGEHPFRPPAQQMIRAAGAGANVTTTVEAIQEFLHVYARRRERAFAIVQAQRYVAGLSPLLRPRRQDLEAGLILYGEHQMLEVFDCVLAATAVGHSASGFVSADRAFAAVEGLPFVDLAGLDVERLLA